MDLALKAKNHIMNFNYRQAFKNAYKYGRLKNYKHLVTSFIYVGPSKQWVNQEQRPEDQ